MIVTFYSYKGGVGRTQLLSNVAAYLCFHKGAKVLCIDWDLEAPGLHYYFKKKSNKLPEKGLIQLFQNYVSIIRNNENISEDILPKPSKEYICNLIKSKKSHGKVDLIPAGKYDDDYSQSINSFDWEEFYNNLDGKIYIEFLKQQLKALDYDYIFIDSRTGVSDYSGICNIQLPEVNVLITVPNLQNFEGTLRIANTIKKSPYIESGYRKPIIFPILSRVDTSVDSESVFWQRKFSEQFHELIEEFSEYADLGSTLAFTEETLLEYKRDISFGETLLFSDDVLDFSDIKTIANPYSRIGEYISFLKLATSKSGYLWQESSRSSQSLKAKEITTIKKMIASGKLREALDALLELAKESEADYNTVLMQSSRLNRMLHDSRRGLVTHERTDLELNKITNSILYLLNDLEESMIHSS